MLCKQNNLSFASSDDQNANTKLENSLPSCSSTLSLNKQINKLSDDPKNEEIIRHKQVDSEEISNQNKIITPIEGVRWKDSCDDTFGLAVSLYEKSLITQKHMGSPIADCFGIVSRSNSAIMALADGVNWGESAKLAARSAIFGCLEYLNISIFGQTSNQRATTTREVFISLLRSFWEAHATILESGGSMTTLTAAVSLPLQGVNEGKFVLCCCNVGDSLGYVYSNTYGVREITKESHDTKTMRDMRNALGALGPVNGNKPELSNLTLSMTICDAGDIIFLTSDGISDNFDPVVGKFVEPLIHNSNKSNASPMNHQSKTSNDKISSATTSRIKAKTKNIFFKESSFNHVISTTRPKYLRSQTFIEPRKTRMLKLDTSKVIRSSTGLPLVTGEQRHELSLLRMSLLLSNGTNPITQSTTVLTAKQVCHLLIDFAKMITAEKRKMLEQSENFHKIVIQENGVKIRVQLNRNRQRYARKKIIESSGFSMLPGKLDHASCIAWKVPTTDQKPLLSIHTDANFKETNF